MARTVWRYTMTRQEQKLWDTEEMDGWREALRSCVEDDARAEGCLKYVLYDRETTTLVKGEVSILPEPEPANT